MQEAKKPKQDRSRDQSSGGYLGALLEGCTVRDRSKEIDVRKQFVDVVDGQREGSKTCPFLPGRAEAETFGPCEHSRARLVMLVVWHPEARGLGL